MVRASSATALLLLAVVAGAQTPPSPAQPTAGADSPGLASKQVPNHNGGLVTYYSGNRLTDDQSQTAVNVFFDRDSAVVKRSGQQLYGSIAGCSAQVRSGGTYLSPAGNSYLFEACGNHAYVSDGNGQFAVIGGTISSVANVYFKQGLGLEWITDGVDNLWSTNGVTVSSYPFTGNITTIGQAPLAQYIGIFQGRVALGNVDGGVSTVYLSGYNNGGDYTLPSVIVDTSAAIFGLNGLNDGRAVTCISDGYRDVLILWNHDEMYGLYGSGNSSFILRKLAEIGCDEQESVQEFDGKLRWLSQYGIYQYDGLNTVRISDPIKDQIINIIATEPGSLSLIQDQFSDWQGGNLAASGSGALMSDTISEDNVVPGTSTFVDDTTSSFVAGTLVNLSTTSGSLALAITTGTVAGGTFASGAGWTAVNGNGCASASVTNGGTFSCNTKSLTVTCPNSAATCAIVAFPETCSGFGTGLDAGVCLRDGATGNVLGQFDANANIGYTIPLTSYATSSSVYVALNLDGTSTTRGCQNPPASGSVYVLENQTTPIGFNMVLDTNHYCSTYPVMTFSNVRVSSYVPSGSYTSSKYDTTFSTPVMSIATLSLSSTSVASVTVQQENSTNGSSWSSPTTLANGGQATNGERYWRYIENFTTTNGTQTATSQGSSSLGASTTGYFITSCFPVAPISSWGTLQSVNSPGNGALTYYVSTGTTCNSVEVATAIWTAQSLNTTISVATAPYIAARVLFNGFSTFQSNNQPTLEDITVNWNSAAGRPRTASQVFDNRYWLAFTTNTSNTAYNNNVLVFDSVGHWSQFRGINAASFTTYNRTLYAGSSLGDGNVVVQNTSDNDLGQPILFDFRTPDYELDAFNTVDLYDLNLEFGAVSTAYAPNMTVQYYADGDSTAYSLGNVPLTIGTKGLIYSNARFGASSASPVKVHTVSFELMDNTTTPITFYRSMLRYTPEDGP